MKSLGHLESEISRGIGETAGVSVFILDSGRIFDGKERDKAI